MLNAELFESFEIELPEDEIRAAIYKTLDGYERVGDLQCDKPIKGYRSAANMPLSFLIRKIGPEPLEEIFKQIVTRHADLKLTELKMDVAGAIQVTGLWSQWDRPLKYRYRIEFERYPEFEVMGLDTLQRRTHVPALIDDAHVNTAIETLRRLHSKWNIVDRPARSGDRVIVDFYGMLEDGDGFPGSQADNVSIDLGAGGMLPEFESGLIGIATGEEREISVSFPENYETVFLAGKQAIFRVLAISISEFDLIQIDDDFAKKVGATDVGTLRDGMRAHLIREHLAQDERDIGIDLLRQLQIANQQVPVPNGLMLSQVQAQQIERAKALGVTPDQTPPDDALITEAHSRVHLAVVVRRLVRQKNIQIDETRDFHEQVIEWLKKRAEDNSPF